MFGTITHELIRSRKTMLPSKLSERSETVRDLLKKYQVHEDIVDFIEKCLVYDPAIRLSPHDALYHQWFFVKKQIHQNQQNQIQ